jgi:hypothetical protein
VGKYFPIWEKFPTKFPKYGEKIPHPGKFFLNMKENSNFSQFFSLNMGKFFPIYREKFFKISLNMGKITIFVSSEIFSKKIQNFH